MPWGDGPDWSSFDAVVIRGTWDYIDARDEFLAWASSLPVPLANPADVLRWNTDKRYLRELEAAGIPVVPTAWGVGNGHAALPDGEFVVKPAVSAGARNSARYNGAADHARARAHVEAIEAAGGVAMVQPFMPAVESVGETGTYVVGGAVSHAIRKMSILDPGAEPGDISDGSVDRVFSAAVDPSLAAFAVRVLAASPGPCLYARVDTVPGPDGSPVLMELEVCEPYLFLDRSPGAAAHFAEATAAWLSWLGGQWA